MRLKFVDYGLLGGLLFLAFGSFFMPSHGHSAGKDQSRLLTGPVETPAGVIIIPLPFDELFPSEPLKKSDRLRGSGISAGNQASLDFLIEQLDAQAEADAVFRWQRNFGNTPKEWAAGHFRI